MICRSIRFFICIYVSVVVAINYSDSESIAGSDHHLTTDNIELFTTEPAPQVKEATPVDLGSLLDAGDGAVVTLAAGDTQLVAHRAVLVRRSPVFAAILSNGTLDASNSVVAVPDVEGPVLRQLVAFLYTLQAPHLPGMAPQLLAAADRYGVSALKAACEQQLAAQLSLETAAAMAVLAVRHSCTSLRQAATAFIRANVFQVLQTQGWIDTMQSQPEDLIKVSQLLSDPPAETSAPPAAAPSTGRTPAASSAAAAPTALCATPPADDPAVSALRNLTTEEKSWRLRDAVEDGNVTELQALLVAGADQGAGRTALHFAAWKGHMEMVRCLLASGAAVDARDRWQQTPLHVTARYGHAALARLLLASHADPNARDKDGWTPLYNAADFDHAAVATVLLEAGADKGVRTNDGKTALDIAELLNHDQLIDILR